MHRPSEFPMSRIGGRATAGLLAAYFVLALLGGEIFGGRTAATALIWPASGVGLALILLRGPRAWPFIFVVALAGSLLSVDASSMAVRITSSLLNAGTSVIEPVVAAWLIWKVAGEEFAERAPPFVLSMLVAVPVAAFIAVAPLAFGELSTGLIAADRQLGFIASWYSAGVSDLMGMLSLTPPIWIWARYPEVRIGRWRALELLVFAVGLAVVFLMPEAAQARYLVVAIHIAIALRFPLKWSSLVVATTSFLYLGIASLALRDLPMENYYALFLDNIAFVIILNLATYVTALLHLETQNRADDLARLVRVLGDTEERERKRLAAVLHDNLQQLLVAAKLSLQHEPDGRTDIARSRIDEAIEVARTLMVDLYPPVLETGGLSPALEWLAAHSRDTTGLDVHVDADKGADPQPFELRYFLFQAARELLLNVAKHAGTDRAWVSLRRGRRWLELKVEDRGKGCAPEDARHDSSTGEHFGLTSIRKRVELYGGVFRMSSQGGCQVSIWLPVSVLTEGAQDSRDPGRARPEN